MPVIPRTSWNGMPQEEATWWSFHRNGQSAVCRMFSHPVGHELRLEISDEPFLSEICHDDEDALGCQERWRVGLEEKRWVRTQFRQMTRISVCWAAADSGQTALALWLH